MIDDNASIHADLRNILCPSPIAAHASEAALFSDPEAPAPPRAAFELSSAFQGQEGLVLARQALAQGQPYALAFVDVRMPPGWDGVETTRELWKIDPDLQIVICTAFADYSWDDMFGRLGRHDQIVIMKKPFDPIEAVQLAHALTAKWTLHRQTSLHLQDLERRVAARTAELARANEALERQVADHRHAEEMLHRQQTELRVLFDLMPAMIWFKDADNRIVRVNQRGAATAGLPVAAIEGRLDEEIYPATAAQHHAEDLEVMRTGESRLGVVEVITDAQGSDQWIQRDKVPYRDHSGKVVGIVVVARDITERMQQEQRLRDSEARMRASVENALDCIISMSADGRITEFNPAAEETFGYRRDDVIGRPLVETIIPASARVAHRAGLARHLATGTTVMVGRRVEVVAMRCDGSEFPVELAITPVGIGMTRSFTAFMRDITERRQREQEIIRINRALKMLSGCHEAMVRADCEQDLLEATCRVVVDVGGYRTAGVGYAEHDAARSISLQAQAGADQHLWASMNLSWSEDLPIGREPAGRTVRNGTAVVIADIRHDPSCMHWRDAALSRGYQSLICLPLRDDRATFGVLALCSGEAFPGGIDELMLLQELADNIAIGIGNIRARLERQREHDSRALMERALEQSLARQQSLSRRLVEVQELAQQQLSSELHDRIGQNLTALSINLNIIGETTVPPDARDALAGRLRDSRALLETTIASVRDLITDLRPVALDDYGLLAGLRGYVAQMHERTGLELSVEGQEPVPRLQSPVERALFRIAQEALTNTVKHAHARQASVRLESTGGRITLTITDDGAGFEAGGLAQKGPRTCWGLEMMRERAEAAGGRLRIESAPGAGTRIVVTLARTP